MISGCQLSMFLYNHINNFFLQLSNSPQGQPPDNLFLNEAVSNYIVFALGILVGIIGWLAVNFFSRQRPQIIEVIRKEQVSLLTIDSQVEKDIKLEYKGKSIQSLHRTSLDLYNRGQKTVKNFTLTLHTETQNLQDKILYKLAVDSSENEIQDIKTFLSDKNIELEIRFLNPFNQYKDKLTFYLFSSIPIEVKDAKGRGPGWGVSYFDLIEYENDLEDGFSQAISGGGRNFFIGVTKSLAVVIKRVTRN